MCSPQLGAAWRRWFRRRLTEVSLAAVTLAAAPPAPVAGADPPATRSVVAGRQYAASGVHRWLFGADYRRLWTAPVEVEVLDLRSEAGGLTPAFRVGGVETLGLALSGPDGRSYTFRGLRKDASALLHEDLRGTIVETLLNDQIAAQHPGSELVARGLLEAAGVLVPPWRLVVLPDDPALGEFREDFRNAVGFFAEYPTARTDRHDGFHGALEIIDHETLYARLRADPAQRVDREAFLKARLMDLLMGDWDRHRKQWRWARFSEEPVWHAIPEDRDQAFARYEGVVLSAGRDREPRFQVFGPEYGGIGGLTTNGREQDRQLLAGTGRGTYQRLARELQAALDDASLERAVRMLPAEWYALDGRRLLAALKARRDALPEIAERFYRHLADRVDVYLTDRPERVEALRRPDGDLELTVRVAGDADGEPTFHRTFHDGETGEVRVYALGGDDRVDVAGGRGPIRVRMIGGPGDDVLDDSRGGGSRLSDSEGRNELEPGPGSSLDPRPYSPPPPPVRAPWIPPRDFGGEAWQVPWLSYGSDLGAFVGWGLELQRYAFRKHPYSANHRFRAGWSFGEESGRIDYRGVFPAENRARFFGFGAYASGVEVLRFYGFGNDTENREDADFYKSHENQLLVYPTIGWRVGENALVSVGPVLNLSDNDTGRGTLVDAERPYGFGSFAQAGVHAALVHDSRDNPQYPRSGLVLAVRGTVWPELLDVEGTFGSVGGEVSGYASAGRWLTLAARAGGRRVFGDYTYREAAALGSGGIGSSLIAGAGATLRGFRPRRFAGDGSVFANADLRLRLGRVRLIVPAHFGVFGFADGGRVFLEGESSDTWHTDYGGGIWISFLNYRNTFSAYAAHSREDTIFRLGGGFSF